MAQARGQAHRIFRQQHAKSMRQALTSHAHVHVAQNKLAGEVERQNERQSLGSSESVLRHMAP